MPKTQLMTNESVLLAAGVTAAQITAIKSSNSTTAVNTLDAIYNILMSFVASQRLEIANLNNPLRVFEKGYADLNNGNLNGMFQEIFVQARDIGTNKLYGGVSREVKKPRNPFSSQDYGKEPIQFTYGVNAKIDRYLEYNREDFKMALMNETLIDFISDKIAVLESENSGSRYAIENNVLNCERYQYLTYAAAPTFTNGYDFNEFVNKVMKSQNFPETNMTYKKIKFNTTRKTGGLCLVLESDFIFKFAERFQAKSFLKPIIFKSEDKDTFGTTSEIDNIIEVDNLTPTTLAENAILNPLKITVATLPANTKLIGRIIDFNATKFGIGSKTSVTYPLDSRISHYDETTDYCFDMCGAYVNVPLLISSTFNYDRKFYTAT